MNENEHAFSNSTDHASDAEILFLRIKQSSVLAVAQDCTTYLIISFVSFKKHINTFPRIYAGLDYQLWLVRMTEVRRNLQRNYLLFIELSFCTGC